MTYRRRSSPLHAARAGVAALFCVVLGLVALSVDHPLVLAALLGLVLAAAAGARVGRDLARVLAWSLPFALLIAAINPLVSRSGVTVVARLGELPPFGRLDVTLEAIAYGGVLGLQALAVIASVALLSAAVDPDELLRVFRRAGLRSALTAALATRIVPVLARDARRVHEAQRLRTDGASSLGVVRAVTAGALDRAVDVAATLEVRGYGSARPARAAARPWSRHDLAFAAATAALAALAVAARIGEWARFDADPRLAAPVTAATLALVAALALAALLPFADRRGTG